MAKKIIRLTESDLTNLVRRVLKEQNQLSGQEVFELQTALNDNTACLFIVLFYLLIYVIVLN